MAIVTVVVIG